MAVATKCAAFYIVLALVAPVQCLARVLVTSNWLKSTSTCADAAVVDAQCDKPAKWSYFMLN